jgi:hypothetical protein
VAKPSRLYEVLSFAISTALFMFVIVLEGSIMVPCEAAVSSILLLAVAAVGAIQLGKIVEEHGGKN